jgi:hypothetical protein
MSNKNTLTLASSVIVVSLTIMQVAIVLHKRRTKSSQTSQFLTQTRSRKQGANTMTGIDRQQLWEKIPKITTGALATVEDNYGDDYDECD